MKYTLYHIKGRKWGMTDQLQTRLKMQGLKLSDCCEFEYYDNVDIGANREKELNLRDGYGWHKAEDYRRVCEMARSSLTPQALINRSNSQMGHMVSEETKRKIGNSRSGKRVGEDGPNPKLTELQVLEIRSKYIPKLYTCNKLAAEYDISNVMISKIINRKRWTHI